MRRASLAPAWHDRSACSIHCSRQSSEVAPRSSVERVTRVTTWMTPDRYLGRVPTDNRFAGHVHPSRQRLGLTHMAPPNRLNDSEERQMAQSTSNTPLKNTGSTVVGLFDDQPTAEAAIQRLTAAGFQEQQIGVAVRDREQQKEIAEGTGTQAAEGAKTGAVSG